MLIWATVKNELELKSFLVVPSYFKEGKFILSQSLQVKMRLINVYHCFKCAWLKLGYIGLLPVANKEGLII